MSMKLRPFDIMMSFYRIKNFSRLFFSTSILIYFIYAAGGLWIDQVDPFDVFDAFFGRSDGVFGDEGGFNFNLRNDRNRGHDIR